MTRFAPFWVLTSLFAGLSACGGTDQAAPPDDGDVSTQEDLLLATPEILATVSNMADFDFEGSRIVYRLTSDLNHLRVCSIPGCTAATSTTLPVTISFIGRTHPTVAGGRVFYTPAGVTNPTLRSIKLDGTGDRLEGEYVCPPGPVCATIFSQFGGAKNQSLDFHVIVPGEDQAAGNMQIKAHPAVERTASTPRPSWVRHANGDGLIVDLPFQPTFVRGATVPDIGGAALAATTPRTVNGVPVAHPAVAMPGSVCPIKKGVCTEWLPLGNPELGAEEINFTATHLYLNEAGLRRCRLSEIANKGTCTLRRVTGGLYPSVPVFYLTPTHIVYLDARSGEVSTIRRIPLPG